MASLSHPLIHSFVGMGVNALTAFATQKADWHSQSMVKAAGIAVGFSFGQIGTVALIKTVSPLEKLIGLVAYIITSNKKQEDSYGNNCEQNRFRLEKVAKVVGGFVCALGLAKLMNRWDANPISMKAAAAFCIIPTLLLLSESPLKPRKVQNESVSQ